jgi:hypothetical protein
VTEICKKNPEKTQKNPGSDEKKEKKNKPILLYGSL